MLHSVPNCLTASQSFEASCFAPPSPLESSPPSSPFDFDLDLLPDEIVSPYNLENSLQVPLISSFATEFQLTNNNNNTDETNIASSKAVTNTFSPDCQVPNSPSNFAIDSEILSPTMFSPSSEETSKKSTGNNAFTNKSNLTWTNSPQEKQQRNVPSGSPLSTSPSSPIYSPAARQQRRLSSTDSGKTSASTASVTSGGALNVLGGNDICTNPSAVSLQESLNEFAQLQQKVRLEQEGLSSPENTFQMSEMTSTGNQSSISIQASMTSNPEVRDVFSNLTPYNPHDIMASSKGGGKTASSICTKSKLHATIKSELTTEFPHSQVCKNVLYPARPTPLLRQVLEDKSFEQRYGVKPLDFLMEPNSLGLMEKSTAESQMVTVPEQDSFGKQDVAGISNNPVISLAMDQVKKDILTTCEILSISPGKLVNIAKNHTIFMFDTI